MHRREFYSDKGQLQKRKHQQQQKTNTDIIILCGKKKNVNVLLSRTGEKIRILALITYIQCYNGSLSKIKQNKFLNKDIQMMEEEVKIAFICRWHDIYEANPKEFTKVTRTDTREFS